MALYLCMYVCMGGLDLLSLSITQEAAAPPHHDTWRLFTSP